MNTLKNYKVNFNYRFEEFYTYGMDVGFLFSDRMKKAMQNIFVENREKLIKELNPRYSEWNDEYDRMFKVITQLTGSDLEKDHQRYIEWIIEKSKPYVNKVNYEMVHYKKMEMFLNPEEDGDIQMRIKFDKDGKKMNIILFITLTEM